MSYQYDPPPPPPPPGADEGTASQAAATNEPRRLRVWHALAAAVLALFVGIGIGAAGDGEEGDPPPAAQTGETTQAADEELEQLGGENEQLQETVESQRGEINDLELQIEALEEQLEVSGDALTRALAALAETQEQEAAEGEEPEPEPETEAPDDPTDGGSTTGDYTFDDVQVRRDFVDDFEVRARVTNTGPSREAVGLAATIFRDGSVVGTASGSHNDWASGQTVTITFISLDSYTDWDEIEFQVEYEF
jgi:hypothetical protein